jgi:hypothetical protein
MRYANFEVSLEGNARADVSVVTFEGDGGGDLENVNRWRQQIGLPAANAKELRTLVLPIQCQSGRILMVDLQSPQGDLLAGWIRNAERCWFFKLTASGSIPEMEKEHFIKFLRSVSLRP